MTDDARRAQLLQVANRVADVARGVDPDDPEWDATYEPDPHVPAQCPVCNRVADIIEGLFAVLSAEVEAERDDLRVVIKHLTRRKETP